MDEKNRKIKSQKAAGYIVFDMSSLVVKISERAASLASPSGEPIAVADEKQIDQQAGGGLFNQARSGDPESGRELLYIMLGKALEDAKVVRWGGTGKSEEHRVALYNPYTGAIATKEGASRRDTRLYQMGLIPVAAGGEIAHVSDEKLTFEDGTRAGIRQAPDRRMVGKALGAHLAG